MSKLTDEDFDNAVIVTNELLELYWNGVDNSPIIIEIDNYRKHMSNRTMTQLDFAKMLIKKYPDFYKQNDENELSRVKQHLPYMDKVLGAKIDISNVRSKDRESYYGRKLDKDYDGLVHQRKK